MKPNSNIHRSNTVAPVIQKLIEFARTAGVDPEQN